MSCFANSIRKKEVLLQQKELIKSKVMLGKPIAQYRASSKDVYTPGPGDYEAAESHSRLVGYKPTGLKNSNFLPTNIDRFAKNEKVDTPGPGTYKLKSDFDVSRHKVFGSAFMSESLRDPFRTKDRPSDQFSPYNSSLIPSKHEFHANLKRKFVI